jgi:hypothetical protein
MHAKDNPQYRIILTWMTASAGMTSAKPQIIWAGLKPAQTQLEGY